MTLQDLQLALNWAAAEGWNPGLDDAEAFYQADPDGFLMGWQGSTPIAAISAIRHNADFGFLGLYICRPAYRGQGFGWQIWQAAMQLFGHRTVGLDGVVEQQSNYAKSGFVLSHNTRRYLGPIAAVVDDRFQPAAPEKLLALDAEISGLSRPHYLQSWFTDTPSRLTLANDEMLAAGTIRKCAEGFKIGPLYAPDARAAESLVKALVAKAGASAAPVSIDAPSHNRAANKLCQGLEMAPVFTTARMYKAGQGPKPHAAEFGICTMELG